MIYCRSLKVLKAIHYTHAEQVCFGKVGKEYGAKLGDWIVDTGNGTDFKVFTNSAFQACFEEVALDEVYAPCGGKALITINEPTTWKEVRERVDAMSREYSVWNK